MKYKNHSIVLAIAEECRERHGSPLPFSEIEKEEILKEILNLETPKKYQDTDVPKKIPKKMQIYVQFFYIKVLKKCSDETLGIILKRIILKIRIYGNELTEKNFFFLFPTVCIFYFFLNYEPSSLHFIFGRRIFSVNNEHMFWETFETSYIVFQVSFNFDPAEEILNISMKKVIILRKIQLTINTFAPPFFNHFSLNLNRKKVCGNESHEKETTEAVVHRYSSK